MTVVHPCARTHGLCGDATRVVRAFPLVATVSLINGKRDKPDGLGSDGGAVTPRNPRAHTTENYIQDTASKSLRTTCERFQGLYRYESRAYVWTSGNNIPR